MNKEECLEILHLERELEEIEDSLLKVVFNKHRRMKPIDICKAGDWISGKDLDFYMAFYREDEDIMYLFNPAFMLRCSQDRKINIMYHEMIHYWCYLEKIKETKDHYHNDKFKAATMANMGDCLYSNDIDGYNEAYLLPEALAEVKKHLEKRKRRL